jgi:predicted NBD/HSP70 family sugar kinase
MKILVIDIGGTSIKLLASGRRKPVKIPSGPQMTAHHMVRLVQRATRDWDYEAVSIGYPGPVKNGKPSENPRNLGGGWVGFNYRRAFGCPVRMMNDAAMQALGNYKGGHMLFLGLGTGLGTAFIINGVVVPMELAHLPYKHGQSYEECVGKAALEAYGKKKWRRNVMDVTARFKAALQADEVVLGGGNAKLIGRTPKGVRSANNLRAFAGGYRLWKDK